MSEVLDGGIGTCQDLWGEGTDLNTPHCSKFDLLPQNTDLAREGLLNGGPDSLGVAQDVPVRSEEWHVHASLLSPGVTPVSPDHSASLPIELLLNVKGAVEPMLEEPQVVLGVEGLL